ncbi:unnamed protein product [Brassicogethes aeneus]|uniref:Glycoprotein endo-alpha-1,2-mannosidase n=1 Tax=Brassicogethes aeneus TaxID=1431903 RepID=A0A9P0FEE2_BRAAE|nr:unnamed protein product [Brassicogethes aeneus]
MALGHQIFSVKLKRKYLVCVIGIATLTYLIISYLQKKTVEHIEPPTRLVPEKFIKQVEYNTDFKIMLIKEKIKRFEHRFNKTRSIILNSKPMLKPNYNVHVFYYAWYNNPEINGEYRHWNHNYLDNWKKYDSRIYPKGSHRPPNDIGSNYYPLLGCYSSTDKDIIETHLKYLRDSGIGVLVISWAPPNYTDSPHEMLATLFRTALNYEIKIALHVEPYNGRNPVNLLEHLKEFLKLYGNHPALYKIKKPLGQQMVPLIYIYDSYLIPAAAWKEVFGNKGNLSVRGTWLDAIYIGLLVELQHKSHIRKSGFDGFYTYFATNSFTYGSTWKNWPVLTKFALQNGLIFIPSVGPGYIDTKVRAWNSANIRHRANGQYYDVAWGTAINNNALYVSITSFNEWHEGTQIEPAVAKTVQGYKYLDYEPEGPYYYLNLTRSWIDQFEKSLN